MVTSLRRRWQRGSGIWRAWTWRRWASRRQHWFSDRWMNLPGLVYEWLCPGWRLRKCFGIRMLVEKKFCSLLIIFSVSRKPGRRFRPCWDVCRQQWVISRHWHRRWVSYKNVLLLRRMVQLLLFRPFMFRQMTWQIPHRPQRSASWTPRRCWVVRSPNWVFIRR